MQNYGSVPINDIWDDVITKNTPVWSGGGSGQLLTGSGAESALINGTKPSRNTTESNKINNY
ncbi:27473_t:CDS:2 [Dentiscutata erythropus]|uniref:27473_t:CDS:1 n=1 Tax=Dentiscutata erythropus TaxID=1348616 RepID=A0A9N9G096_9GLOM|nr:27473_t:CDS:2 [Dentiscutata erythropus]